MCTHSNDRSCHVECNHFLLKFFRVYLKTRHNSHIIKFTVLKWTICVFWHIHKAVQPWPLTPEHFHPKKVTLSQLTVNAYFSHPVSGNCQTTLFLYKFTCSEHFMKMKLYSTETSLPGFFHLAKNFQSSTLLLLLWFEWFAYMPQGFLRWKLIPIVRDKEER